MSLQPPESLTPTSGRIVSMDQFRGYTVFAMLIVNYLGKFTNTWEPLKHDDYWLNFPDTIMPAFIFAVGFSFRLTILRRIPKFGATKTYLTYIKRSLALCLVSIVIYGAGVEFGPYDSFFENPYTGEVATDQLAIYNAGQSAFFDIPPYFGQHCLVLLAQFFKSALWETLAIIGGTQLLIMPVIRLSFWGRVLTMVGFSLTHVFITWWFNWQFMYGWQQDGIWINPEIGLHNWMGDLFETGGRSWDGGLFGLFGFASVMLAGSLCYDLQAKYPPQIAWKKIAITGIGLFVVGYLLSCLSCLYQYDVAKHASDEIYLSRIGKDGELIKNRFVYDHAAHPVLPDFSNYANIDTYLAPFPVFGDIPETLDDSGLPYYLKNYWITAKRTITLPYAMITTGIAMVTLSFFIIFSDIWGRKVRVFEMLGMNPLAAYFLHKVFWISFWSQTFDTKTAAPWLITVTFIAYMVLTLGMIRSLDRQKIFVRM
ncbi:hypothetical protein Pla110_14700 [Polystyrenella longa]|uniref:Heparan-alpha-glucosaminide N-acetyltransferase catalytic domain-containing protein n=1 Tax=Polystyrenella longa TaxID=2528007 RepID=A0A518CKK6_9PLAN|nr:heparan-alpha-glucosaminide N-acetyltransferase domain-containing protein [Polystyrenella longa]QDU79756.1 hypothetical protein Pla110_14700 [Polystyrenella longa]